MREQKYRKIYPREYIGYVITTILWNIVIIFIITITATELKANVKFNLEETITFSFVGFLILYGISMTINMTVTCFFLKYKKIYFEYSSDEVIFNGAFNRKSLKVQDINYTTRSGYRNLLGYTHIKSKRGNLEGRSKKILFAMAWFSDRDIKNMIEFLLTHNKGIIVKGIYPSSYVVRSTRKQMKKEK